MKKSYELILASGSPRRKQLMEECGFDIRVVPSAVEEIISKDWNIEDVPCNLAHLKATDVWGQMGGNSNTVVIGADTIVVYNGEILGKPINEADAFSMIKKLSDNKHDVYTGVSFCGGLELNFVEKTTVHFAEILDFQINYYIEKYKPMDKAGAYGIQDWLGMCFVTKIEGCYTNVMGLPMQRVYESLSKIS